MFIPPGSPLDDLLIFRATARTNPSSLFPSCQVVQQTIQHRVPYQHHQANNTWVHDLGLIGDSFEVWIIFHAVCVCHSLRVCGWYYPWGMSRGFVCDIIQDCMTWLSPSSSQHQSSFTHTHAVSLRGCCHQGVFTFTHTAWYHNAACNTGGWGLGQNHPKVRGQVKFQIKNILQHSEFFYLHPHVTNNFPSPPLSDRKCIASHTMRLASGFWIQ